MRTLLLLFILITSGPVQSQTSFPVSFMDYMHRVNFGNTNYTTDKKWFWTTYSGVSTSFNFFNGGNATIISAPLGLQLNRRLNNNLYAFTGVSVAPAYVNFNGAFSTTAFDKLNPNNGLFKYNGFGAYSRAELGLMYVNDARTFSVSGSVGVQRNSFPYFPYQQPPNGSYNNGLAPKKYR